MTLCLTICACAIKPTPDEEKWIEIPGIAKDAETAAAKLVQTLWSEGGKFKLGRYRSLIVPVSRIAVGSVLDTSGYRTLLSQRLENGLVKSLGKISGRPVFPRNLMVAWEEDLAMRGVPDRIGMRPLSPDFSIRAAALGGVDTLVGGRYQVLGNRVVISAQLLRMAPALATGTLSVARARVTLPLGSLQHTEVSGRIPSRKRNILPVVPRDWTWSPLSVWYEVIEADGHRRKGLDGASVNASASYLISFLPTQSIYVLLLRINSEGQAQVLFPARGADLSKRIEEGRRYGIPGRLSTTSQWVSTYVLFAKEAFRYRRDILPNVQKLLDQIQQGSIVGPTQTDLALPLGIFQKRFWFTKSRSFPLASGGGSGPNR